MRSASHSRFGDPAKELALHDAPVPTPESGEVRIRMTLSPIHNHDLLIVRGEYGFRPTLPAIGGSEAVGVIDALGAGVSGISVGQRVSVAGVQGCWAEYFTAPQSAVVPLPDSIRDEIAAQLLAMPLSSLMLLEFIGARPGQWVVQNAANGAVGKLVAEFARSRDVRVVNLVRREAGAEDLAKAGVRNAVVTGPGWQERTREMMGGAMAEAVVDSIGGGASAELLPLLREGGLLVSFGSLTGEPLQIPPGELIYRDVTVKGFWAARISSSMTMETKHRLVGELIQRAAAGELKLPVEAVYPLADVAKAAAASLQPGRNGKVLLRP